MCNEWKNAVATVCLPVKNKFIAFISPLNQIFLGELKRCARFKRDDENLLFYPKDMHIDNSTLCVFKKRTE